MGSSPTFTVDLSRDSSDGCCMADADSMGRCNLRAAVLSAQKLAHATIELAVDAQVELGQMAIMPPEGESLDLTITASSGHIIRGTQSSRLFSIGANATVRIARVHIEEFADVDGGAVLNRGTLHIADTTFANNGASCLGVGVLTGFATCGGGAIANTGTLTLGTGTRFEGNSVSAVASTASYTDAGASGGAIRSSGSIVVEGPVLFTDNTATATAQSGIHEGRPGGATADSSGGAIYNAGSLTFADTAKGCAFVANGVFAHASAVSPFPREAKSSGGAIRSPGTLLLSPGLCSFQHNQPPTGDDVDASPAAEPGVEPVAEHA